MKYLIGIILLLGLGAFGVMNSQNFFNGGNDFDVPIGYKIGETATDFNLKNVDGEFYSLAKIEDAKGYVVVFTSNVCPFAVLYEDRLIELHNDLAPKGYPVVAINSNDPSMQEGDSFENMKLRAQEKNFPFLYLEDEGEKIFPQYGATKTPHVFLLDSDLKVQYIGAIDDNAHEPEAVKTKFLRNAVAALEKGELPDPNFTKAIGCPIKSKNAGGGSAQKGKRRGPPSPEAILARMDSDKDEKISAAEAEGPLKRDFAGLDKDEDGFLTKEELSAISKRRH